MSEIEALIERLVQGESNLYWHGAASEDSIDRLEELLGTQLPLSFREFLAKYGGGGLIDEEISRIEDNDSTIDNRGTVYGDTNACRERFALPANLVVIYLGSNDVVWCLDTALYEKGECPVVSFDVYTQSTRRLSNNLKIFLIQYLQLRVNR